MVINISVQYSGGLLPDIILLTQRLLPVGNPVKIPCNGFVFTTFVDHV